MDIIISKTGKLFGKPKEVIDKELLATVTKAALYIEKEVKSVTPVGFHGNRGAGLKNTIYSEVTRTPRTLKAIISHQSKYGNVIEYGRRPRKAFPPRGALISWIKFKLPNVTAQERPFVELAIRRKIHYRGFEGKHMFGKTWKREENMVDTMFQNAGFSIARKLTE